MELREYLHVLRRRWTLVLVPVIVGAAAAAGLVASSPTYESTTILYARPSARAAVSTALPIDQRLKSYVRLVSERRLAVAVDRELNRPETPKDLQDQISATARSGELLLDISVEDDSPEGARSVADAAAGQLLRLVDDLERERGGRSTPPVQFSVAQAASPPTTDTVADTAQSAGFGAALGLMLGIVAALVREALDTAVRSDRDVRDATGVLAGVQVPTDRAARRDPVGSLLDDRDGPRAESFRRLRVRLFPRGEPNPPTPLLVTGSTPGDGATSTACGLALTLAESGFDVVLVGVDAAQSPLGSYLDMNDEAGLTDVVVRGVPLDSVLRPWGGGRLHVIPAGSTSASPSELLRSDAMASLIKELEARFDVVVIDAPPLLAATEAAVLGSATGGVVLAVRYGRTRRDDVREAADLLAEVGANILVVVLNAVPRRARRVFRASRPHVRRRGRGSHGGRSALRGRGSQAISDGSGARLRGRA